MFIFDEIQVHENSQMTSPLQVFAYIYFKDPSFFPKHVSPRCAIFIDYTYPIIICLRCCWNCKLHMRVGLQHLGLCLVQVRYLIHDDWMNT